MMSCLHMVYMQLAEVTDDLRLGPHGWNLDRFDLGVGRHYSDKFQDPTLARPSMSGRKFRTTLLRDAGEWYVLELCEPLETLIDPSAEIYGYEGSRDLITIITDGEKDPLVMGFKLASDEPLVPAERNEHAMGEIDVAPEDEIVGVDIDGNVDAQGAEITPQGRLVVVPSPTDKVMVDGVELTAESSLQALRTALSSKGLSTSGQSRNVSKDFWSFRRRLSLRSFSPQLPNLNRISAVNPVHSLCRILQIKQLRTNTILRICHTKHGAQHVSASERVQMLTETLELQEVEAHPQSVLTSAM